VEVSWIVDATVDDGVGRLVGRLVGRDVGVDVDVKVISIPGSSSTFHILFVVVGRSTVTPTITEKAITTETDAKNNKKQTRMIILNFEGALSILSMISVILRRYRHVFELEFKFKFEEGGRPRMGDSSPPPPVEDRGGVGSSLEYHKLIFSIPVE